ncbi:MAG: response regulator [Thermoflexia bacterium]|nr:MAG: response regulator [Thermoflexia bacterium]
MARRWVLIVDSNPAFATLLQQELESMEMRADVAANGHETLWATVAADYTMAIVDMGLPDPQPSRWCAPCVRSIRNSG